jgi:elongator complex protein 3
MSNKDRAIKELLKRKINSREELMVEKRKIAKKFGMGILTNAEILKYLKSHDEGESRLAGFARLPLKNILRKRAIRTMSGIAPVAVLVKPYKCPGKCAYCPTEKDVPQSYLANEPAVMRAIRCDYDPYVQVQARLKALEDNGHQPEKIELIVIGGTWSYLPEEYKFWFIEECFRGANDYGIKNYELKITNFESSKNYKLKNLEIDPAVAGLKIENLKLKLREEQQKNEIAKYKIIGITLETRPDYINEKELLEMRELGCTRVELGVQAIDDKILKLNKRGHGAKEVADATKLLKNFGFKVTYHIMPGLPGSTANKDVKMFKQLFSDERFQPDQIKFYPTVVTKGSLLYRWWQQGKYKPYSDKVLANLIIACKKIVPPYVRIIRLIRDIPGESIVAGNLITNLRQVLQQRGVKCNCIRCREANERQLTINNLQLTITDYDASGGREYFISADSKDPSTSSGRSGKILYGFCRLRLGSLKHENISAKGGSASGGITLKQYDDRKPGFGYPKPSFLDDSALIRELHVYGELVPVGGKKKVQHVGLGKKLMLEAEKIARENGYKKIAVIAGVGARGYYRKLGYRLEESYMVKLLNC